MDLAEVLSVSSFNIKEWFGASDGPQTILIDERDKPKVCVRSRFLVVMVI